MKETKISRTGDPASTLFQFKTVPPHRILVVEDDGDIRRLNAEVLVDSGYAVDAAEDGAVAWDSLQFNSYDLMITDNQMPKVTGVELLQKLHATRMALPVIMTTGTLPREEFTRCPWLLPAATLLKPYTIAELLETVRLVLRTIDSPGEQIAPPNWQSHQPVAGMRL